MDAVLNSVVPLFAVIGLGFLAGRFGRLDQAGVRGLVAFVFYFALPCLLFRLMATADLGESEPWRFVLVYLAAEALVFVGGMVIGGAAFRMSFAEAAIQGFGSGFSNGVFLALPLLLSLYGEAGAAPALLLITFDALIFSVVTLLLELGRRGEGGRSIGELLLATLRSVAGNPIILGTFGGLLMRLTGLELLPVLDSTLAFLGQAATPAALFALGATLSLRPVRAGLRPASAMIVTKLFAHPLLVFVLATAAGGLEPLWINVAVLFAACPVGANVYLFAQHYEVGVEQASTAILISTALSLLTIAGLVLLLPVPG